MLSHANTINNNNNLSSANNNNNNNNNSASTNLTVSVSASSVSSRQIVVSKFGSSVVSVSWCYVRKQSLLSLNSNGKFSYHSILDPLHLSINSNNQISFSLNNHLFISNTSSSSSSSSSCELSFVSAPKSQMQTRTKYELMIKQHNKQIAKRYQQQQHHNHSDSKLIKFNQLLIVKIILFFRRSYAISINLILFPSFYL